MSHSLDSDAKFSTLRSFFFPIHSHELKKFMPMLLMISLICFNYSILRNLKDSIILTASGAEIIPFIKVWVLLPTAILLTIIFARLTNRYSQERVFYIMLSVFLIFFAFFAYVLFPLRETLHPHATAHAWQESYPHLYWFIALYENWVFTLFYVMSELWGTIILQVIFWGFANEVTRIYEARRFYSVFSIGSNVALALAGLCSLLFISTDFSNADPNVVLTFEAKEAMWQEKLKWIMSFILFIGLIIMAVFRWANKNVLTDPSFDALHHVGKIKVKKRQSLKESFYHLSNSKYLLCIGVIVVSYNLTINLVELVWKDQLKVLYPSQQDLMTFMSYLAIAMGIVSTLTAFFMSHIISRFGWTFTALITPITMMITSIGFFSFLFFRDTLSPMAIALIGASPLAISAYIGFVQNCFSKAAKYSVFDATKEMAFIPLDHESKLKGKAAIDGVGSRLGKSGGSLIHGGLIMIFHTLSNSSHYVAAILLAVIVCWILAVKSLGKQFKILTEPEEMESEKTESTMEPAMALNSANVNQQATATM